MKGVLRIAAGLALTVFFLWLFLRNADLASAGRAIEGADAGLLTLAVALNLAAYLIRAWRWRQLLAPMRERIGLYNLTATTFIGFMTTFLVPMRIGEIVRPVLLARRERVSASSAIATIALERLFDAFTVMTLFLVFSLSAHGRLILDPADAGAAHADTAALLRKGALAASLLVAIGLPLAILLVAFPRFFIGWLHRMNPGGPDTKLGKLIAILEDFLGGLGSLRSARHLSQIVLSSLLMWLTIDLSTWYGIRAFGLPLGFFDMFLLMVALTVGISVPLTPGGLGPYEAFCSAALINFWQAPAPAANAASITLHAVAVVPTVLIGLFFMWRDGVRPAEMRTLAAEEAHP